MTSVHTETRSGPDGGRDAVPTPPVSLPRLHLLRAGYLVIAGGLVLTTWPGFLERDWSPTEAVVQCVLAAVSVLCLVGIRHPLAMLPVLLFEVAWKLIWLAVVALPLWLTGEVDAVTRSTTYDLLWVVVPLVAVPWGHVVACYVRAPGAPWRAR